MTTDRANSLKSYYQGLYAQFGDSHQSVQHVSKEAQNVRFKIFLEQISKTLQSLKRSQAIGF